MSLEVMCWVQNQGIDLNLQATIVYTSKNKGAFFGVVINLQEWRSILWAKASRYTDCTSAGEEKTRE